MTVAVLACELFVLLSLFVAALSASGAQLQAPQGPVRPRLELACEIAVWAVPALLGVAAAWRRFWVITGVQACLLLLMARFW
jgi:hypothetical protein